MIRITWRPWCDRFPVASVLLCAAFCFVLRPSAFAAATMDERGLIPPASGDHSPRVADIRRYWAVADLADAQREIRILIQSEPRNFEGYFWSGVVELQGNDNYDAIRSLRRAEALDANPPVLKLLAFSYYRVRQFSLFLSTMNAARAKQPEDFAPYYYLGRYYADDLNDFSKAAQYFRQSIDRNPGNFYAQYYLGHCQEIEQNVADAEARYKVSIQLAETANARFAPPYQGMARLKLLRNQPEDALPSAMRAVALAPNDATNHEDLAKIYSALGRQTDAVREWEQTTTLDPTNASPYYHLYRFYLATGDEEKAKSALAQFTELSARY